MSGGGEAAESASAVASAGIIPVADSAAAAADGEGDARARHHWSCPSCTLRNPHSSSSCDACRRPRRRSSLEGSRPTGGGRNDRGGGFSSPAPPAPGASSAVVVIDLVSGGSMETARNKKRKRRRMATTDGGIDEEKETERSAGDGARWRRRGGDRGRGVIDVEDGGGGGGGGGGRFDDDATEREGHGEGGGGVSKSTGGFFGIFVATNGDDGGGGGAGGAGRVGVATSSSRSGDGPDGPVVSSSSSSSSSAAERGRQPRRRHGDDGREFDDVAAGTGRGVGGGGRSYASSSREAERRSESNRGYGGDVENVEKAGRSRRDRDDDDEVAHRENRRQRHHRSNDPDPDRRPRQRSSSPPPAGENGGRERRRGRDDDEEVQRGTRWQHHGSTDHNPDHGRRRRSPSPPAFDAGAAAPREVVPRGHNIPHETRLARSRSILLDTFKIPSLRNLQPTAVSNALEGKSQIIVMATGAGKSLCYQLPAATLPGLAIVVSPLIALMQDQVRGLNGRGVKAALVCSANGARENGAVLDSLRRRAGGVVATSSSTASTAASTAAATAADADTAPAEEEGADEIKLLYCTPELIETPRFRSVLSSLHTRDLVSLVAIDEAHCLSTWGHDFRPAYRRLNSLRGILGGVPVMACTATATPNVIGDIRTCLGLAEGIVPLYRGGFNRENIRYEVRFKDSLDVLSPRGAIGDLIDVIKKQHSSASASASATAGRNGAGPRGGIAEGAAAAAPVEQCSGIVYVHKRADTSKLAHQITKATGIKAAAYHAGLSDASRKQTQQQWTSGIIQVAVATVAFGMGIDLPHVRYVIHWTLAKSIEGFYQESGRGGRDGKPALSILYYSKEDASKFSFLIKKTMESRRLKRQRERNASQSRDKVSQEQDDRSFDALQKMCDYCTKPCCKRQYLLKHFGETIDATVCNKTCDFCQDPTKVEEAIRSSDVMKQVAKQSSSYRSAGSGKAQGASQKEWDGQWDRPHGSEGDDDVGDKNGDWDDFDDGGLAVYGNRTGSTNTDGIDRGAMKGSKVGVARAGSRGFVKAKDVLAKYEMMECQEGKTGGFVNFRDKKSDAPPVVPSHLRSENMPDPLSLSTTSQQPQACRRDENMDGKSSADIGCEVERLKAELAQLKAKRATRLANHAADASAPLEAATSLGYKARKAGVPAPPPPILFRPKTSKKGRK